MLTLCHHVPLGMTPIMGNDNTSKTDNFDDTSNQVKSKQQNSLNIDQNKQNEVRCTSNTSVLETGMKHTIILSRISHDLIQPLTLHNRISARLPNINLKIFPMKQHTELKVHFGEFQDKNVFKHKDFGPNATMNIFEERQKNSLHNNFYLCNQRRPD